MEVVNKNCLFFMIMTMMIFWKNKIQYIHLGMSMCGGGFLITLGHETAL